MNEKYYFIYGNYLIIKSAFNDPFESLNIIEKNNFTHIIFSNHNNFLKHVADILNILIIHQYLPYLLSQFNELVDNLPCSITHLTLGYSFNKPVDNLPCLITHLTFYHNFNQTINCLPNSLIYLDISKSINYDKNISIYQKI